MIKIKEMKKHETYKIYAVDVYESTTSKYDKLTPFEGSEKQIVEELKHKNLSYHERLFAVDELKLNIDLDGNKDFDGFITKILEYSSTFPELVIKKDDIKYTVNKGYKKEGESYHISIPKYSMNSALQNKFWKDFRTVKDCSTAEIDCGHLGAKKTGKWYRLPLQIKSKLYNNSNPADTKGTEHEIVKGNVKDFLLKSVSKSMNIDSIMEKIETKTKTKTKTKKSNSQPK